MRDEERIYDLVCRRLLSAWHSDHVSATTTVITAVTAREDEAADAEPWVDRYRSSGTQVEREGWKVLDLRPARARPGATPAEPDLPPGLAVGQAQRVLDVRSEEKQTRPPRRFTEGSLLTAMETAGKALDDEELAEAMRECGLGTPATRAATIETLLDRGYIEREKKALRATAKGLELIAAVHPDVRSPALTGRFEAKLKSIEQGGLSLAAFMREIEAFVIELVRQLRGVERPGASKAGNARPPASSPPRQKGARQLDPANPRAVPMRGGAASAGRGGSAESASPRARSGAAARSAATRRASDASPGPLFASVAAAEPAAPSRGSDASASRVAGGSAPRQSSSAAEGRNVPRERGLSGARRVPTAPDALPDLLHAVFGFADFRPHQAEVCRKLTAGEDALLVMPTGAGKSLCYQLPTLAREGSGGGGEPADRADGRSGRQAAAANGLRAERIHSGRSRADAARCAAKEYLDGASSTILFHRARAPLVCRAFPSDAGRAHAGVGGRRRGALHLAVGPRLPPRLSNAEANACLRCARRRSLALTATATPVRAGRDIARPAWDLELRTHRDRTAFAARTSRSRSSRMKRRVCAIAATDRAAERSRANRPAIVYSPTSQEGRSSSRAPWPSAFLRPSTTRACPRPNARAGAARAFIERHDSR